MGYNPEVRKPTKFVDPLSDAQRERLKDIHKTDANARIRMRAHAILLSDKRYSIDQISDIYEVDRDRVAEWVNRWSERQFDGLADDPRSGRPPILDDDGKKKL
jgi:transposase